MVIVYEPILFLLFFRCMSLLYLFINLSRQSNCLAETLLFYSTFTLLSTHYYYGYVIGDLIPHLRILNR